MTLIKSISGIRGTIGGEISENLTPIDVVKFTSAYAQFIKNRSNKSKIKIVIGRDARLSGEMVSNLVSGTLIGMGVEVIDLGLSTTPTVEIAVPMEHADGGIIITASHNPKQWNALKLLNEKGEFISGSEGEELINIADDGNYSFSEVDDLGTYSKDDTYIHKHINAVLDLELVDKEAIIDAGFRIVVDAVNSSGGIFIPELLKEFGVEVIELYCEPTGHFPHNPEPLAENLTEISKLVVEHNADLGIVVDPDVDRLAFVCNDGSMFGEEYTLVAVGDYVTKHTPGNTVSNLSSTRALNDVTVKNGGKYFASAVGEVNVVDKMKAENAVIGGEGNGGIIYPESHYGRDALVGVGLFLTHLAKEKVTSRELRDSYPNYEMSKNKIQLTPQIDVDDILLKMKEKYKNERVNDIDGVKIDFANEWVHLRKSNTEPIIRVYSESGTKEGSAKIAQQVIDDIHTIINE
ncbi:phosphoglucosamine mutase [Flavobacteriales bacterium]|nr:phosphoglucosamine mutase [Flavobacteriales bacterium]